MQLSTAVVVFMGFFYWTHNRLQYCRNVQHLSASEQSKWLSPSPSLFRNLRPDLVNHLYHLYRPILSLSLSRDRSTPVASCFVVDCSTRTGGRPRDVPVAMPMFSLASSIDENLFIRAGERRKSSLTMSSTHRFVLERGKNALATRRFAWWHCLIDCSVRWQRKSILSLSPLEAKTADQVETSKVSCPDFSQYLYFLFAPTLIYREKYPRNAVIHWDYVLEMFGQVFAAIVYVYYVVVRFCVPVFANLNQNQITLPIFISVLFNSIMPGSLFLLLGKDRIVSAGDRRASV